LLLNETTLERMDGARRNFPCRIGQFWTKVSIGSSGLAQISKPAEESNGKATRCPIKSGDGNEAMRTKRMRSNIFHQKVSHIIFCFTSDFSFVVFLAQK